MSHIKKLGIKSIKLPEEMVDEKGPKSYLGIVVVVAPEIIHALVTNFSVELQNGQNHVYDQLNGSNDRHENVILSFFYGYGHRN